MLFQNMKTIFLYLTTQSHLRLPPDYFLVSRLPWKNILYGIDPENYVMINHNHF